MPRPNEIKLKPPPKTLTGSECFLLLEEIKKHSKSPTNAFKALRNYTMTLLMLDAGLRVGEVVKLKKNCVIFAGQVATSIVITSDISKTHTERTIPMSARLISTLDVFSQYWPTLAAPGDRVFCFTKTILGQPLTVRQVQRIIRHASLTAFGRAVHPHTLRHTFATRVMKRTNARVVQQLLGHTQLSSTQIYTHPDLQDLSDAIKELDKDNGRDAPQTLEDAKTPLEAAGQDS